MNAVGPDFPKNITKGARQKLPNGFFPLSFFGQNDFRLRAGREKSVEMEGKNLVVFVVDDNIKKQRVKRCYHQMLHLLTNGQGVNADLSHSLKQCTLSQQESLFSAKIEFFF